MSTVISIVSGKGGTGKSTVSIGVAASLAKNNHSVLLIDLDIGLRSLDIMLGVEGKIVYDIQDILDGRCNVEKAIIKCELIPNLHLMSAPFDVAKNFDITQVANLINTVKSKYDYVVLDNSAGIGTGVYMAKAAADFAIIVTTPDMVSVRDASKIAQTLTAKTKTTYSLIINKIDKSSLLLSEYDNLDQIIDTVGARLLGIIPTDYAISKLFSNLNYKESSTVSSQIFNNIARRIEGKYVPLYTKTI